MTRGIADDETASPVVERRSPGFQVVPMYPNRMLIAINGADLMQTAYDREDSSEILALAYQVEDLHVASADSDYASLRRRLRSM